MDSGEKEVAAAAAAAATADSLVVSGGGVGRVGDGVPADSCSAAMEVGDILRL